MVRKEVKKQEILQEEQVAEDADIEGDELFEGLESVTPD